MGITPVGGLLMRMGKRSESSTVNRCQFFRRENLPRRPFTGDGPVPQTHDVIRILRHHRQIVRDEQDCDSRLAIKLGNQIVKLRLVFEVNSRRRFVQQ